MGFQAKPGEPTQGLRVEIGLEEASRRSLLRLLSLSLSIVDAMAEQHSTTNTTGAAAADGGSNTAGAVVGESAMSGIATAIVTIAITTLLVLLWQLCHSVRPVEEKARGEVREVEVQCTLHYPLPEQ
eukprot:3774886-Amphidinium_carterae.1